VEVPPLQKSKLEELLEQALKNNPDLRVASAKLVEAEAELSRMRLQVVQKVVQAYQAVEAAKALAAFHEKELKRFQELVAKGGVSAEALAEKEKQLAAAKAQVAAAEADLAYLVGKSAAKAIVRDTAAQALVDDLIQRGLMASRLNDEAMRALGYYPPSAALVQAAAHKTSGPMAERIRKALDQSKNVECNDVPLSEVLEFIQKAWSVPVIGKLDAAARAAKIKAQFENITLGAFLQFLEDEVSDQVFVVRDYGLLLVPRAHVPPGALRVSELRPHAPEQTKDEKKP
jgi:hypothetical protein